ncbi:TBC1 domain family member 13 [Galdieria sulphuraria]|nr:TBC1 domain family member 13 [Galdieria sulphuraria]
MMTSPLDKIASYLCSHQPFALQKRVVELVHLLQQDPNRISSYIILYGIPEVAGLRALVWSCCIRHWLAFHRTDSYWDGVALYCRYPTEQLWKDDSCSETVDHPLNPSQDSIWQQYFSDQRLMDRIRMDTSRTHPDWHLFRQREPSMIRMNELVAPFVYVYLWDGSLVWDEKEGEAEAFIAFDSFFCSFVASLYQNISYLQEALVQAELLLKQWDSLLWQHLKRHQVDWSLFARRWLQLCLCREFELPELLKIWDVLLSIPNHSSLRWTWLIRFIVVMVLHCK